MLRDCGVSLKSMLQHGEAIASGPASDEEAVPIVLVTHQTREAAMRRAVDLISALDVVLERPTMIRIEAG